MRGPGEPAGGQEPTLLADVIDEADGDPRLEPGTVLAGRFEISRCLGEGGAGSVYAARDRLLGEPVALKLLHRRVGPGTDVASLRAEVRAARRIAHPNVCRVHDLCEHGGRVFLVMELLAGETLRQRLRQALSVVEALEIARQLGAALTAAHRAGVVHCDVKPENALLAGGRVVLTDFGIARRLGGDGERGGRRGDGEGAGAASTGIEGTPAYMAPEQLLARPIDERTDVYALAAVVYELFAGRPPLGKVGEAPIGALVDRILIETPALADDLPAGASDAARAALRAALARGLAKEPARRFESVEAFVAAVVAALGSGSEAAPLAAGVLDTSFGELPLEQATAPARPAAFAAEEAARSVSSLRTPGRARGTRRLATVLHLVVDAPGAEDDDELAERAESLLAACDAALADAGAIVIGRLPRSVVAAFGAAISRGDEPQRAADTARALGAAAAAGLVVRVGIDTGRLLVREDGERLAVSGDAVARAAQLATSAGAGEVLVSARAARHVARRYVVEPAGASAARVVARRRVDERVAPLAPLYGRDAELERLLHALAAPVRSGERGAVLLLGAPGLGKSRLLREALEVLDARGGLRVIATAAEPGHALAPYGVLRLLLRRLAGLEPGAGADEADEAARRLLGGSPVQESVEQGARAAASKAIVRTLAALLAGAGRGAGAAGSSALAAARAAFTSAARAGPLVVIVDDAQWADDGTLDLLEALARGELEAPLALLVLARPELAELRPRLRAAFPVVIDLPRLPPVAATALAASCLGVGADAEAARALAAAADGNPFFVEELAEDLRQRGGASGGPAPTTVEEAIQAHLDRLSLDERELLRAASVLGLGFRRAALPPLLAAADVILSPGELDDRLAGLEARNILAAQPADADADDRFAIRHALLRDAAYRELVPAARRALHAAAATELRRRMHTGASGTSGPAGFPTTPGSITYDTGEAHELVVVQGVEPLVELARHLEGAEQKDEAADVLRRAGDLAALQHARGEAYRCYARARDLLGERASVALLIDLGDSALEAGAFAAAEAALDAALARLALGDGSGGSGARARSAGSERADDAARAHALVLRAQVMQQRARWDDALADARAGLAALGEGGERREPELAARLRGLLGWVLGYIRGDNEAGLPESLRAVELLERRGAPAELAGAYSRLGANYMRAGRWRDQLQCNRRTLELAEQAGALELVARAHINLGVNLQALGELDESLSHTRRALALYERMCATHAIALARNNLGGTLTDVGRVSEAAAELAEAIRLSDRCGGGYFRAEAEVTLARLAVRAGNLAGGRAPAEAAIARAHAEGGRVDEAIGRKVLAAVLSRLGEPEAALAELDAALAIVKDADLGERARVHAERARVLDRAGRGASASAARDVARVELAVLGATLDLAKLGELAWI